MLGVLAILLLALIAVGAPSVFAAGNTISVSPPTTPTTTGASFSVSVGANGSVAISGAGASLNFDKTRLTLTALAKDADVLANGASYAGFPSPANLPAFIAAANASGTVPTVAWTFTDGSSNLGAGVVHGIFSATFHVSACGASSLVPVVVPGVGGILDGTPANYGNSLTVTGLGNGAVANACPTAPPTPSPSAKPSPSPSVAPSPSSAPSASPKPSASPVPSASPSAAPSASPSAAPSASPSSAPSAPPSASPSPVGTPAPTDGNPTPTPSGAVLAATATPPSTDTLSGPPASPPAQGSADVWMLVIIALIVIIASADLVTGKRGHRRRR